MNYGEIARWSVVASSIAFAVVLIWGFRKLGVPAIAKAQEAKNQEIAAAEARVQRMKAQVEGLQGQLASADSDAAAIRQRAEEQAQRERVAMLEEAKRSGERVVQNAEGELTRARAAARVALRNELVSSALELARKEASARIDESVNAQLVDRFMRSIGRVVN